MAMIPRLTLQLVNHHFTFSLFFLSLVTPHSGLQSIPSSNMLSGETHTSIEDDGTLGKETHTEMTTSPIEGQQHLAQPFSSPAYTRDSVSSEAKPNINREEAIQKPANHEYVTGLKLAAIVACVALGCFLMLVDTMVISTVIPRITDEFHSLVDVGWYASAYQFGISAPQPLIGKVYTHFKTKWTYLFCFGLFELGSVLCGAARSSIMLIIGRAVAGLGAAGIINGAITILSGCAPLEKRPTLFGLTMGIQQLGLVIGPIIGGAFTSYTTWRWSFYINLPIGAVVLFGMIILPIPEQTVKPKVLTILPKLAHHLDLVGFVLFAPAVIQFLLALQYGGNQYAWNSSQVIGLFCGAGATTIIWLLWNYHKGEDALLPPAMLRRRTVWTAGLFNAFQMASMYGTLYYLPIYFQAINNASAILSGVYIMPFFLPQLLTAAAAGPVIQKMGYLIPIAIFATILLSVGSGLLSTLRPSSLAGEWIGYQLIAGIGSGAGLQLAIVAIQSVTTGEELSSGMAFMVFTQSLFPAVLLTLCNLILVENLKTQLPIYAPHVPPEIILKAGATNFRGTVAVDDLPGVLVAYSSSINCVFYLVASLAVASILFVWGFGWRDLRKGDKSSVAAVDGAIPTSDKEADEEGKITP
ncbi:efflux pump [Xylariaceae sp. FL0662B]|nr:efflux pump [Xylariaceae sp. FL0662B]